MSIQLGNRIRAARVEGSVLILRNMFSDIAVELLG